MFDSVSVTCMLILSSVDRFVYPFYFRSISTEQVHFTINFNTINLFLGSSSVLLNGGIILF